MKSANIIALILSHSHHSHLIPIESPNKSLINGLNYGQSLILIQSPYQKISILA